MTDKTDADILHEAREIIRERGWTRGTMLDTEGHVCGYGAVAISQGWLVNADTETTVNQDTCKRVLAKVLIAVGVREPSQMVDIDLSDFTGWNDDEVETQQEIEDAFAKAEKIERAGYDPDAP